MASTAILRPDPGAERLAAWSAGIGFLGSLVVAAVSGRLLLDERAGGASILGALGFSVAWTAPFIASLASFLSHDPQLRRTVWLATGVLAMALGGLTLFSGVWLLFGPAGGGLIAAWWMSRGRVGWLRPAQNVLVTTWLLVLLGGALAVLWLQETPACWQATATGGSWVAASSTECASDIINDLEGLLALIGVAVGLAGLAVMGRDGGNRFGTGGLLADGSSSDGNRQPFRA